MNCSILQLLSLSKCHLQISMYFVCFKKISYCNCHYQVSLHQSYRLFCECYKQAKQKQSSKDFLKVYYYFWYVTKTSIHIKGMFCFVICGRNIMMIVIWCPPIKHQHKSTKIDNTYNIRIMFLGFSCWIIIRHLTV